MYARAISLAAPWPVDRQMMIHLALIAALLVSLLAPLTPPVSLPSSRSSVEPAQHNAATFSDYFAEAALPTGEPTLRPTTWQGHAEILERRDAFTRHYDLGDGKAAALLSATPQHFADPAGQWATLDPRFTATEDGYIVRQNSLVSSLSGETSAALVQHGQSALGWLPQALVALDDAGGSIHTLAQPLSTEDENAIARTTVSPDGATLTYTNHWSDATLSETFVSKPGSLEQSLILAQVPQINDWAQRLQGWVMGAQPTLLALETELYLLSGEILWANGAAQTGSFSTAGQADQTLTLRNADGETALSFAPVFAYEQANPAVRVAGHYEGELVEPGVWRLRIVTPWSWWADPSRIYPAVLDPEIYVEALQPVSYTERVAYSNINEGIYLDGETDVDRVKMAWGAFLGKNEDDEYFPLADYAIETDVRFSKLPVLPPVTQISGATLLLDGMLLGNEMRIELVDVAGGNVLAERTLSVAETVDFCAAPGCDRYASYSENVHLEIELPADQIVPVIEAWYAGDNQGLRLRPYDYGENEFCNTITTIFSGSSLSHECAFVTQSGPKLWIHYDEPTLAANGVTANQPIPSYDETYFGRSYHEYRTGALPQDWNAVAVIGDADTNTHVRTPLNVLGKEVDQRTGSTINRTVNFVVLDNTSGQLPTQVRPMVEKRVDNFSNGPIAGADYDLQWRTAAAGLGDPTPVWATFDLSLNRAHLVHVLPFELAAQHNLYVRVRTPSDNQIHVELVAPASGLDDPATDDDDLYAPYLLGRGESYQSPPATTDGDGNKVYKMEGAGQTPFAERWALVVAHDGVNTFCPIQPEGVAAASADAANASGCPTLQISVEMLACPPGEYPTDRYGCQPLLYPHEQIGGGVILPPGGAAAAGADAATATVSRTATHDVGGVRIFSEGGFVGGPFGGAPDPGFFGGNYAICTTGEEAGMPLLGLTSDIVPATSGQAPAQRLIPVRQGSVCVTGSGAIEVVDPPRPGGGVYGAMVGPSIRENSRRPVRFYNDEVELYHGRIDLAGQFGTLDSGTMAQDANNEFRLNSSGQKLTLMEPWEGWNGMLGIDSYIEINERSATGQQGGTITVVADDDKPDSGIAQVTVDSQWRRRAILPQPGFELDFAGAAQPPALSLSSLELRFHAAGAPYLLPGSDKVAEIHLLDATAHQPENMGAAYRPITAVIRKSGAKIREPYQSTMDADDNLQTCGATRSCLDVRNADDIFSADWQMPDVDIADEMGSLLVQQAGMLHLYSNDHPDAGKLSQVNAAGVDAAGFSQSFNFKAFSVDATMEIGTCGEGENAVENATILRAHGKVSPPVIGSDGVTQFEAAYTVCENKLRHIFIKFNVFPPGIPIGGSGIVLSQLEGSVDIGPASTRIEMGVDFRTADGFTLTGGGATVVIDTGGYFSITGRAELVAKFDAEGTLAVAWDPIDVLQEASIGYEDWFEGFIRFHMWVGQGYQAKYHWLPDNNDVHFTGTIGANLTLKKGRIGEFWKIKLPPVDIVFSVEVSFGEFCTNAGCTKYEWGVQGKITVLSFTIGLYVGKSGVDFFIGNKGHTLIDQFESVLAASISAVPLGPISDIGDGKQLDLGPVAPPCPQEGTLATCTFSVQPDTGQLLFSVGWSDGTLPTAVLHAPDGTEISALSAAMTSDESMGPSVTIYEQMVGASTVQFVLNSDGAFYTVGNPQAGDWTLTLDNLLGPEAYSVLFAANSPPPQLALTTPNNTPANGALAIQWNVTPVDDETTVHLAYVTEAEYQAYQAGIAAGASITEVGGLRAGAPVGPPLPAAQGSYNWQPVGLASGSYYVVARVDHPVHGSSYAFSPGPFTYVDTTPPAAPGGALLRSEPGSADGLLFSWDRVADADLAAYEVVYNSPDLDAPGGTRERILRITPTDPRLAHPLREQTRLVGLLESMETSVCVRAVDASGNVGPCSATRTGTPQLTGFALYAPPVLTSVAAGEPSGPDASLAVQWTPGLGSDGFLLQWAYGCGGAFYGPPADQGATNLDVGNTTNMSLTGLPPGTYRVQVRGYQQTDGLRSVIESIGYASNTMRAVLTNGVDSDGDGLPDDWANHFGVQGAGEDPDGDGVNNGLELLHATDPTDPDSDHDGFSDGEELFAWATDACDPTDSPDRNQVLTMLVYPRDADGDLTKSLRFEAAPGKNPNESQSIRVASRGQGQLDWQAFASDNWIKLSPPSGAGIKPFRYGAVIDVSVDATGLEPGYYEGHVRIQSNIGAPVHNAPQKVPVRLWVQRKYVENKTRITGYVFLDENGNGVEDPGEGVRVANVEVGVVNAMGAVMASQFSSAGSGNFSFSQLPHASYGILAQHPDMDFLVTTPNPQPVQISAQNELVDGVKIGVVRKQSLSDSDGDGVPDAQELIDGTNPNDPGSFKDRDGDGVPDFVENGQGTNPNNSVSYRDSDGDGAPDYIEELDETNPHDAASFKDANGNGVPDYLEDRQPSVGGSTVYLSLIMHEVMTAAASDAPATDTQANAPVADAATADTPDRTETTLSVQLYLPTVMK
ncbi:MAG: hypothetical protein DCC55_03850 [Chloroflexi bacterium]|nr:MAG: hypothetical protein DCC55_03850 [Chloroflexota bacterium]